jgi:hypothetical protein
MCVNCLLVEISLQAMIVPGSCHLINKHFDQQTRNKEIKNPNPKVNKQFKGHKTTFAKCSET